MVLRRAGSAKSTLSMMERKATKYQRFLNVSNVFLLIVSTFLMFSAAVLARMKISQKCSPITEQRSSGTCNYVQHTLDQGQCRLTHQVRP